MFSSFFIRRPRFAMVIAVVLMVAGGIARPPCRLHSIPMWHRRR